MTDQDDYIKALEKVAKVAKQIRYFKPTHPVDVHEMRMILKGQMDKALLELDRCESGYHYSYSNFYDFTEDDMIDE